MWSPFSYESGCYLHFQLGRSHPYHPGTRAYWIKRETFLRVRVDRCRFAWLSTGYSLHPGGACGLISSHTSAVPLPQTTKKNHVSTLSVLKVLGQIIVQMRTVICNDHHVITWESVRHQYPNFYYNIASKGCLIKFNCSSVLHIPIVHAHDVSKQIPRKKISFGLKCYKTIGSYVSCAFIEIWSTREVWRALKKLELFSATPRATLASWVLSKLP